MKKKHIDVLTLGIMTLTLTIEIVAFILSHKKTEQKNTDRPTVKETEWYT